MMKIDTHGVKMTGLKAAAHETHSAQPYGPYIQISYDPDTGKVMTEYHISVNNWTNYLPGIVHVTNAKSPMTMQEIADAVASAVTGEEHSPIY